MRISIFFCNFVPAIQNRDIMKTKFLICFNAILTFLLGSFGLISCIRSKYGVPYAEFTASGIVTDRETGQPIENIQVKIKERGSQVAPEIYTNQDGRYMLNRAMTFPYDSIDIIAQDTAGAYEADSTRVRIEYEKQKGSKRDEWYTGEAFVSQDFKLKKKS